MHLNVSILVLLFVLGSSQWCKHNARLLIVRRYSRQQTFGSFPLLMLSWKQTHHIPEAGYLILYGKQLHGLSFLLILGRFLLKCVAMISYDIICQELHKLHLQETDLGVRGNLRASLSGCVPISVAYAVLCIVCVFRIVL